MKNLAQAAPSPGYVASYLKLLTQTWDRFWFAPQAPHTLACIRIATGAMLLYMHVVWAADLGGFLGKNAWIGRDTVRLIHQYDYTWSYLWYIDSMGLLWANHIVMLAVAAMLMLGLFTRVTAPLAWFMNLMYCHRLTGHLFGLDQVVMMLMMYLMISNSGSLYSLDRLWFSHASSNKENNKRRNFWFPSSLPAVNNNIATRLIQVHLCIIYLFGGISKLRGEMWWDGSALWYAVTNWEYQSIDMVWVGQYPMFLGALAHLTIFWETFYCATAWPRLLRPWTLLLAFVVHFGIAFGLGMITFGTMMIVANAAFVSPQWIQKRLSRFEG